MSVEGVSRPAAVNNLISEHHRFGSSGGVGVSEIMSEISQSARILIKFGTSIH